MNHETTKARTQTNYGYPLPRALQAAQAKALKSTQERYTHPLVPPGTPALSEQRQSLPSPQQACNGRLPCFLRNFH